MSDLRGLHTPRDRNAFRILMFARHYHNQKFLFLTLTFANMGGRSPSENLMYLMRFLRKKHNIEYFAVRTDEGQGVFHIALVSRFIHRSEIKRIWESLTGGWNVHISYERNLHSFVKEMTAQDLTVRYSRSRDFVPVGIVPYLDYLVRQVTKKNRVRSYQQFARRISFLIGGSGGQVGESQLKEAAYRTYICSMRFYGLASDIKTRTILCL